MSNEPGKVELPPDLLKAMGEAFGAIASAETFALVGLSIQLWSHLEKTVNSSLALLIARVPADKPTPQDLLRLDNALIAVGGKDIKVSLGAIRTIISFNFPAHLKDFDDLKDKIELALLPKRHIFAHHIILEEKPNGSVIFGEVKSIGKMKFVRTPFTWRQLASIPFEFIAYHKRLDALVENLGFRLPR